MNMHGVLTICSCALRFLHESAARIRVRILPPLEVIGHRAILFWGAAFAVTAGAAYLSATFYAVGSEFSLADNYRRIDELGVQIEQARAHLIEKESAVLSARADHLPAWVRIKSAASVAPDAVARAASVGLPN